MTTPAADEPFHHDINTTPRATPQALEAFVNIVETLGAVQGFDRQEMAMVCARLFLEILNAGRGHAAYCAPCGADWAAEKDQYAAWMLMVATAAGAILETPVEADNAATFDYRFTPYTAGQLLFTSFSEKAH